LKYRRNDTVKWTSAVFFCLICASCSPQPTLDRAGVVQVVEKEMPSKTRKAQLETPLQLAVYFKPVSDTEGRNPPQWQWTSEDREHITRTLQRLKKLSVLSGYSILGEPQTMNPAALRRATTNAGAQALLVLHGAGDASERRNGAARLYPLLITTLFVAGNETEGVFSAGATLWDSDQSRAYSRLTAEGRKLTVAPMWFTDMDATVAVARERAVRKLRGQLYREFVDLAFASGSAPGREIEAGALLPRQAPKDVRKEVDMHHGKPN
jgi:hypothetical protein